MGYIELLKTNFACPFATFKKPCCLLYFVVRDKKCYLLKTVLWVAIATFFKANTLK